MALPIFKRAEMAWQTTTLHGPRKGWTPKKETFKPISRLRSGFCVYSYRRRQPNAADKTLQVAQGGTGCVRHKAQFFERKVRAVDPEGWVTKRFGSCRIPAAKRREGNFLAFHPKCVNTHLVSTRVGLISPNLVGTAVRFENTLQSGVPDRCI